MASRRTQAAWDDHPQQYAVPAYNPSDYYIPRPTSVDYYSPVAPSSDSHSLDLRRPMHQDMSFAISAVSPGLPIRPAGGRDSAASILLDRFFGRQPHSPLPPQATGIPVPQAYLHGTTAAALSSPGFQCISPPVTPGPPTSLPSLRGQSQYFPPPPPGPPPSDPRLSRNHSVLKEITVPPGEYEREPEAISMEAASIAFRQPARGQAPRPLRDRELAAAFPKVPSYPVQRQDRFETPQVMPMKSPPLGKRSKPAPAPIDVQLAEGRATSRRDQPARSAPIQQRQQVVPSDVQRARDEAAARLQGMQRVPQTAALPSLRISRAAPISPTRGLPLTSLNTNITKPHPRSVLVDIALSPSMSPIVANPKSPITFSRNSSGSTPPMWSPETPRAMSFDFPMIISDMTPTIKSIEWTDPRRETIIEEDIQEQTPMELGPPRGRIYDQSPSHVRARSLSPPGSAYPKESSFSWDLADLHTRHATDEDFYDMSNDEQYQMIEDQAYLPQSNAFNPRQTILGTYFKC